MGKWSTYARRGYTQEFGSMAAPTIGDWSVTSPVSGQYSFNRLNPIPGPATRWGGRLRLAAGAWSATAIQAATPITGAATTGQTYTCQVAWFDANNNQLSPWSDSKTVLIT